MFVTLAYFCADTIMMIALFEPGTYYDLLIHHILVTAGTLLTNYFGGVLLTMNYLGFLAEISNLPLNMITFLESFELKSNIVYYASGISMAISFFFSRVLLFAWIVFKGINFGYPGVDHYDFAAGKEGLELFAVRFIQTLFVAFYCLNLFWFVLVLHACVKPFLSADEGKKAKSC